MNGETEKVLLRTYQQVWSQERVIYQIERVHLPFPVSFQQAGLFAAALLAVAILSQVPVLGRLPVLLRYVLAPGIVTWYLTKQRLDGKPPLRWLWSVLQFAFSTKQLNRWQPATAPLWARLAPRIGKRWRP